MSEFLRNSYEIALRQRHVDVLAFAWFRDACAFGRSELQKSGIRSRKSGIRSRKSGICSRKVATNNDGIIILNARAYQA